MLLYVLDLRSSVLSGALVGALLACSGCSGGDLTLPDGDAPANIAAVAGDGQSGLVGSRLDDPLVVRVTDAQGRPVAGVRVAFRFTEAVSGADVDPGTDETGEDGRAAAEVRLGTEVGMQRVEARVDDADLRTNFQLTALVPSGDGDDDDDDSGGGRRNRGDDGDDGDD